MVQSSAPKDHGADNRGVLSALKLTIAELGGKSRVD